MYAVPEELQEEFEIHGLQQSMHPKKSADQTCKQNIGTASLGLDHLCPICKLQSMSRKTKNCPFIIVQQRRGQGKNIILNLLVLQYRGIHKLKFQNDSRCRQTLVFESYISFRHLIVNKYIKTDKQLKERHEHTQMEDRQTQNQRQVVSRTKIMLLQSLNPL